MPRVVPSDVVATIERMFPKMISQPKPRMVKLDDLPTLLVVVRLVDALPDSLIVVPLDRYTELKANVALLASLPELFQPEASRRQFSRCLARIKTP